MSAGDVVEVYRVATGAPDAAVNLLDADETARLAKLLRPQDRNRYVTGHLLTRLVLQAHTGIAPADQCFDRTCPFCGADHGKPRLIQAPDVHVSLSYSSPHVVVAVSHGRPVGIDIEQWQATDFAGFSTAALTEEEAQELLAFQVPDRVWARAVWWARKEAVLKATGHGLSVDATSVRISPPDRPGRLLDWTDSAVPAPSLRLADVPFVDEYACAVARLGEDEFEVAVRDADDLIASYGD